MTISFTLILSIMSSLIEDNNLSITESSNILTQKLPRRGKSCTHNLKNYCRNPIENEPSRDQKSGKPISYCNSCEYFTPVLTNFRTHLTNKHGIEIEAAKSKVVEIALHGIDIEARTPLDKEELQDALCQLIVRRSLPLRATSWPELHHLLLVANPETEGALPTSHNTIRLYIQKGWLEAQAKIKDDLLKAQSKIHLGVDVWTSPNTHLFLGITAHFVRKGEARRSKALLGLKEVASQSGESQSYILLPLLTEYGIAEKLGAIIGDNSSTNDTLCRTISSWLKEKHEINWDPEIQRVRCIGHVINLFVQAFLFTTISEEELTAYDQEDMQVEAEEDSDRATQEQKKKARQDKIRQMGPIGKLHNIVVYIRSSGNRTAEFTQEAERRIPLDNRTRWNSWYNMLKVALSLEKHIDFYTKNNQPELEKDILSPPDWESLRTLCSFLQKFHDITLQNEGDKRDISQSIPSLFLLRSHCQIWKAKIERGRVRTKN